MATRKQRQLERREKPTKVNRVQIEVPYTRSPDSRLVHIDGAWGGVTPHMEIYVALYSEHNALPTSARLTVDPSTRTATQEFLSEKNTLWHRQVQTELVMTRQTATALRDWLTGRLEVADEIAKDESNTYRTVNSEGTEAKYADSN